MQEHRFANTLELAVRFGKTFVVYDVDFIEPLMFSLLRKDLQKQGPREVVSIGDKFVDYNQGFQLYLLTREANIQLSPDAKPLVSLTNFTITKSGLEGEIQVHRSRIPIDLVVVHICGQFFLQVSC